MDYIPYGDEWIKEMSKLPKDAILRMFSKMGIEKNQEYQQLKKSKTGDRDCEELKERINELERGLQELIRVKHYKDTYGKDGHYNIIQPIAWEQAKKLLNL